MKHPGKKQIVVFLFVIGFGVGAFSIWSFAQSKNNVDRIIIENKTRFLTVESVKSVTGTGETSLFEVSFKNNYDKPVSIYRFRVADELSDKDTTSAVERDGSAGGWTLKSGEAHSARFSAAAKGKIFLTIAAVLFEDGTGDGEPVDLTRLQENRAGVWMAFNKVIPLLKEALKKGPGFFERFPNRIAGKRARSIKR